MIVLFDSARHPSHLLLSVDSQFFFPSMSSRVPCKYFFNVSLPTCHSGCDVFIFDYCRRLIGVGGEGFKH
ncbi:unnamed protein product [Linum trigynum]|uniref:Uncharacterized protein n=1 Tax=Linum trigynum TaxID=586398 RepID=A0AAV2FVF8_9ROSI